MSDPLRPIDSPKPPAPARIVRWNLTAKRREYADADAVIVSPGKAGRTWLRVALHKYLSLRFDIPFDVDRLDPLGQAASDLPRLVYSHELGAHRRDDGPWKRLMGGSLLPDRIAADLKVVILARDPRDVIVSSYFQKSKRSNRIDMSLSEFLRHRRYGIHGIVLMLNAWRRRFQAHPRAHWLRYEDMIEDQGRELRKLLAFLGVDVRPDALAEAVEFASFGKMQEAEARDAFGTRRLRPTDRADPETFKVRRGQVGGYRDYLKGSDLRYVDKALARLDPFYGYSLRELSATPPILDWQAGSYVPNPLEGKSLLVIGADTDTVVRDAAARGADPIDVVDSVSAVAEAHDVLLGLAPAGEDSDTVDRIRALSARAHEWLILESGDDPAPLRRLLAERTALFSSVESHPSPRAPRRLLAAKRRRIGRLILIAGPTAAGKSTMIDRLQAGEAPEVAERLGVRDWASLPVAESRQFKDLTDPYLEALVYHRNILRPHLDEARSYEKDETLDLLATSKQISIVTLWCSPKQLHRQLRDRLRAGRRARGSTAHTRKLRALEDYTHPERVSAYYRTWFEYIAKIPAERFVLTTSNGVEVFSEEEWELRERD